MILAGIKLMIIGMGIVFTFLLLLYFSLLFSAKFIAVPSADFAGSAKSKQQDDNDELLAVITAAVRRYRSF